MPYAVWTIPGGTEVDKYKVDGMPDLICGVAVPITEEQVLVAKYLHNVIVFNKVLGVDEVLPEEKEIVFEGTKYRVRDGIYDPPVEEETYERMVEAGVV
jgi:hypothetical protein